MSLVFRTQYENKRPNFYLITVLLNVVQNVIIEVSRKVERTQTMADMLLHKSTSSAILPFRKGCPPGRLALLCKQC